MVSPARSSTTETGFAALELASSLVDAVTALGYEEPTPVQRENDPAHALGPGSRRPGGNGHRENGGVSRADHCASAIAQPKGRRDRFSLVEVPDNVADEVVTAMRRATLRGQKVPVRPDRAAT